MNTGGNSSIASRSARPGGKTAAIILCWFFGIGVTLPWNSISTIGDYYYNLFPVSGNWETTLPSWRVLALVSQPLSLATSAILSYNVSKISTRKKTIFGFIIFSLSICGLLVIDLATSGKGRRGNYVAVCVFVASFGVASAHVEGGVLGELSFMCHEFIQSFTAGLAASGALASSLRLITKASFDNSHNDLRKGVIVFLCVSMLFEFICIFLYAYIFARLPIVKHFRRKVALEGSTTVAVELAATGIQTQSKMTMVVDEERLSNRQLILQNIDYALGIFLTYSLTLSIFPGFLYENTGRHHLGSWYSIVLIAIFNGWDFISRYLPLMECIKLESRKGLLLASILRLAFVPCFYYTSKFGQEGWMIMLVSLLGLTNGYITVCIFTVAPRGYQAPEQNALGNLLVLFLLMGLLCGACLDLLWTL